MKDELVTFETGKLAREKGFKEECFYYYSDNGNIQEPYLENGSSSDTDFRVDLTDLLEIHNTPYLSRYSAPTQSSLQKWLREEHNIDITICLTGALDYGYYIHINRNYTNDGEHRSANWHKYEEALEAGLFEALNLIKL